VTTIATVAFWVALGAIVYVYAGYPLLLLLLGALKRRLPTPPDGHEPDVTLLVSAYNEEAVIREKIENSLALDYPRERLEVLVASDGSTDRTAAIVAEYTDRGVRLLRYPVNRGKNATLNDAIPEARGELIVFTDANGKFAPSALRKLARHFADPAVGCVCGELHYLSGDDNLVARGYNVYWRYDQRLKRLESRLGCLLGANGSIFAIRRRLYRPLPNSIPNDMVVPIQIAAQGYEVVYDPEAVSREAGSEDAPEELGRRSRIVGRGILGVRAVLPGVWRSGRGLLLWELVSRKLLRYCTPFLFGGLLLANLFLWTGVYALTLAGQAVFYAAALAAALLRRGGLSVRVLSFPLYFVLGNLATALGWWKVVTRRELGRWETVARTYDAQIPAGGSVGGPRR